MFDKVEYFIVNMTVNLLTSLNSYVFKILYEYFQNTNFDKTLYFITTDQVSLYKLLNNKFLKAIFLSNPIKITATFFKKV